MSDLIDNLFEDPEQVWRDLDSFIKERLVASDVSLVKFVTYASLVNFSQSLADSEHFRAAQSALTLETYARLPWYPIIVYRDLLINRSYLPYSGGGYQYQAGPPQILYGQAGPTAYKYVVAEPFASVPTLVDSITDTKVVFDGATMSYSNGTFIFSIDPFSLITAKTSAESGRQYIVLWAKEAEIDYTVPFNWLGWTLQFKGAGTEYTNALRSLWSAVTRGLSIQEFQKGILTAAGAPAVTATEVVRDIVNDGYRYVLSTDTTSYKSIPQFVVSVGDTIRPGQAITKGVIFKDGQTCTSLSATDLPGIALFTPLSTGRVVTLYFPNGTYSWTYDAGRLSKWRFPIGGEVADVEQYWQDRNEDYSLYYPSLTPPGPYSVNPMALLVTDLLKNAIYTVVIDPSLLTADPSGFLDRAATLLPQGVYVIVQQKMGAPTDILDVGAETESVGYGYHASGISDVVSTSATDATLRDYAPIVTIS